MKWLENRLDAYFEIGARGSSLRVELLAGVSTFASLAYIVVVHPSIMATAGYNKSAVFFATVVVSALATIGMGLWARLPFALAPGLEMDGYVAFFVVGVLLFTPEQALGIVFWSTTIFFLLSVLRIRQRIIESIPDGMKYALSTTIGVFVAVIGLKLSGIIVFTRDTPTGVGSLTSPQAVALYIGVAVIAVCEIVKLRGSVLVGIVASALYCAAKGLSVGTEPVKLSGDMLSLVGRLDVSVILDPRAWAPILILFIIDFYGSVAKIIGLTINTSIFDKATGQPLNTSKGLNVDGLAALASPIVGSSSVTTFVVSGVGIRVGGRTGITAVVCGILILFTILLAPIVRFVPVVATSGALLTVGWWLLPKKAVREQFATVDWIVAVGMALMAFISFSLERAMLFGYLGYIVHLMFWKRQRPNAYLIASFLLLLIGFGVRFFGVIG